MVASRPEAGNVPSSTEAVGGWMTARWSSAARNEMETSRSRGVPRSRSPLGFPRRTAESLRRWRSSRVLVTRSVGCRSGIEAPCQCDRGRPKGFTRAQRRATEKATVPDGARCHSPRRRVLKGAQKGRKAFRKPLGHGVREYVGPRSSFESRPQKVRGALELASTKPVCQKARVQAP